MASYLDFDLLLSRGNDSYHARVLNSPAGQASVAFRLLFSEAELDEFFKLLGYKRPASLLLTVPRKAIRLSARTFGGRLFGALFRGAVGECLRRSLDAAERSGAGLRLRLRLTEVPDLAALPWEYLYDPSTDRFFALSDQTPLVRYLDLPSSEKPLQVTRPLRILVVVATPYDWSALHVAREWQKIQETLSELEERGLVVLEWLKNATFEGLQGQLRNKERRPELVEGYHVLHFIGHGVFDERGQEGGLVLEDAKGRGRITPASVLGTLLRDHRSLRLVLLNACEGARGGRYTPFAGTAQHLIQQGLPSVIAMQFAISDQAAIALTHEFYRALADGYPVDAALAEARKAILGQKAGSIMKRAAEWAVPTLFMRAPDGKLFEIEGVGEEGPAPGAPPFKGLRYFDEQDSPRFFGRERLTAELVAHLRTHRVLAVVGASGSGKSSLVRAGLIPALKRGEALPPLPLPDGHDELTDGTRPASGETRPPSGSTTWPIHIITPTNQPLKALAASLTREVESVTATATLIDDLKQDARALDLYASKLLSQDSHQDGRRRLLLVVDQFEELFTLCRDNAARQAFVHNLMQAVATDSATVLIIALRADFYAHCSRFDRLRQALETKQKYIGPMSADELRRAIEKPAAQGQWGFQAGLVDLLLEEVEEEPGGLPLLSHALFSTWARRQGRTLTFAGYYASGGVKGAIAHTAERVFQQELNAEQQEIARFVFLRLTELGEGTQDTRRRVELSELIGDPEKQAMIEGVIRKLADARLITTDSRTLAPPTDEQVVNVEVAHEALIREWPTLREWLDEDRAGLRIHRSLTEAMQEWQTLNRDPDALYRGVRLSQALEWATEHRGELNPEERRFLEASQEFAERIKAEREAQQQRELEQAQALAKEAEARRQAEEERAEEAERATKRVQRRNMWVMGFGIAALLLALVAGLFYFQAEERRIEAENQTRIATVRQLAAQSQALIGVAPLRSLLLALEALRLTEQVNERLAAPEESLRNALANTGGISLSGHKDQITEMAISSNNHWLVTGSLDNTARLWDLTKEKPSAEPMLLAGHEGPILAVSISPNNHWLVTGSHDNTARLWNLTREDPSAEPMRLVGHQGPIWAVSISADNRWLVTGSDDGTARLWDLTKLDPSAESILLKGHSGPIDALSISPDNRWLVTGSHDGTPRLWDLTKLDPSAEPMLLAANEGDMLLVVSFSPDNRWLVTGSLDNTARLWDLTREDPSAEPMLLAGHEDSILAVTISPDNHWLVTGSWDKTARLWDLTKLDPSAEPMLLAGHEGPIPAVSISPDNRWLVTGSLDGTARLWDLTKPGPESNPIILAGNEGPIWAVSISPDNRWLVTGSEDGKARLWDLTKADPESNPIVLAGHQGPIQALSISPDNHWLVTRSRDNTARLWDLTRHNPSAEPMLLAGHKDSIFAVSISPDIIPGGGHQWLVTVSQDGTARLWDLTREDSSAEPMLLGGHEASIQAVSISPDGHRLVTASYDGTARLWDLTREDPSTEPMLLAANEGRILLAVSFSPDNRWLATGSLDNTARLWDLTRPDPSAEPMVLAGHQGSIRAVSISPDNRWLVTGSEDRTARLWDLTREDPSAEPIVLAGHEGSIEAVSISPDKRWLVTVSYDETARLWDLTKEDPFAEPMLLADDEDRISAVSISPDGHWLVTRGGSLRLWDLTKPDPEAEPIVLAGHEGPILAVSISLDNHWLATGSDDGTARLWDLTREDPSAEPIVLAGHEDSIQAVSISSDNHWLVTGSKDGTARLWNLRLHELRELACRTAGRNLNQKEWDQYFKGQPYRQTCPNFPVHYTIINTITQKGTELARAGEIDGAKAKFSEAQALSSEEVISAYDRDVLCWYGSLSEQAADVLDACERAVELAPDNGWIRDSRGLARALTGDYAGAIEDFQFYVEWSKENGRDEAARAQREAWIETLQAGENPFDAETLEALK